MIKTATTIRRRARPTTGKGPRLGVAVSLLLHAGIAAAALLVWNRALDTSDKTPIVPVDLITIAQKTDIAPMQVVKPPKEEVTPPALNLAQVPTPPDVQPPKVEVAPDTKPIPKTNKAIQQDFSDLLNDLTKPQKGKHGARSAQGNGTQMAADLASALVSQIYKCWNPPTGVPHADQMLVTVKLSLNPDGSVAQPPQSSADFGGPYVSAAIGAAERAIQTCAPYKLPANRYSQWRQSTVIFDPRNLAQ